MSAEGCMSRNLVAPETAERNREKGGYTFRAPIPSTYEGPAFTVAAVRLGDHAHIEIETARAAPEVRPARPDEWADIRNRGYAGRLVMQWPDWLAFRALLDQHEAVLVAEVENPTPAQLTRYTGPREGDADAR